MQHALVEYLVNAAWQIPLMAAAAMVLCAIAGLTPRGQNRAWLVFLIAAVAQPAFPIVLATLHHPPAALPGPIPPLGHVLAPTTAAPHPGVAARALRIGVDGRSAFLILTVFVLAAAFALARLVWAMAGAGRLVRRSCAVALPASVAQSLARFAAARGTKAPPVRQCDEIASPVVVGVIRPVVLVPRAFFQLGDEDMRAALLHEFAHVARRDFGVNLLCELATLPVNWHPATHAIKAGIRRTRELACDSIASAEMASEAAYAKCLVSLARSLGASPAPRTAAWIPGLFGRSNLEERIMRLLKPNQAVSGGQRMARLLGGTAVAAAILIPAILLRVTPAFAQVPPPISQDAPIAPVAPDPSTPTSEQAAAPMSADRVAAPTPHSGPATSHHEEETSGNAVIVSEDGIRYSRRLTPEERRRVDAMIARAKDQARAAVRESVEVKRVLADVQARRTEIEAVERPEMQRQIAEALAKAQLAVSRAQLEGLDRPETQRRIAEAVSKAKIEASRAALEAVNRPEVQREIADAVSKAQLEASKEALEAVNSPEMQRQIAAATAILKDPELQETIDRARKQAEAAMRQAGRQATP
jgi:beta-lactamase regulating signal transducer with metallopeptidase domain